jgi:hypothetical protein
MEQAGQVGTSLREELFGLAERADRLAQSLRVIAHGSA